MVGFTYSLNPITGDNTWEEQIEDYDHYQEVARSGFADMLHDHERNQKYYLAIKSAINKMHAKNKKANVLDIGAGTGLLSMMAASCGADTVFSCEELSAVAKCAEKIIQDNGFGDKIKLIHKRSTFLTVGENGDIPKRANILVTEVFDTELIGEGALSTFTHAHKYLLEEDCIVIPNNATIWVQVVTSKAMSAWNRIRPISDVDSKEVLIDVPSSVNACSGALALHDIQLSQLPRDCFRQLLPPQRMFKFDWSGKTPISFHEKVSLSIKSLADGTADAVFMWWELEMDTDRRIVLSCAPVWEHPDAQKLLDDIEYSDSSELVDKIPWRDHWMQAVYYFPSEVSIGFDETVNLVGYYSDYSFWFEMKKELRNNSDSTHHEDDMMGVCKCGVHVAYSRARIGQLNDQKRNSAYLNVLRRCVNENTVCLCLSDGSLLGLAASRVGAKKVYVLETNSLSRRNTEAFIEANGLSKTVEIVDETSRLPSKDDINLIFAEPYFVTSIMPWDNLRYWYLVSRYPRHINRVVIAATIKAVAMEFKDLFKIRAPFGVCEGFDLSSFNELVQKSRDLCDNPVEAHPLWEYPGKALTEPFVVANFDFTKDVNDHENVRLSGSVPILENGLCNGVAIWVDWKLCTTSTVTTGPIKPVTPGTRVAWDPYVKQGVYFIREIAKVTTDRDTLQWSFSFKPEFGTVDFQFSVSPSN